jgi:long-subunit fatty acid transport protein
MRTLLFVTLGLFLATRVEAQFPEDALRLSSIGLGVGSRSLGMGMAYTGIANDYSAVYWNPAGLGQMRMSEMSIGLSHNTFGNSASFLGAKRLFDNSSTDLNNFGLVYPFPTSRGSLVFAIGYSRVNDFTTSLSFDGFNRQNSIIPVMNSTLAYELYLIDSVGNTPLADSMQQRGKVLEGGGLNNWSFAVAVEAARQLYLGISLNVVSGSYTYNREYVETDVLNKYSQARYGVDYAFSRLGLINTIDGDMSGMTFRLGMLYRLDSGARFGINIKTPSFISVREKFSSDGTSVFDVPDSYGIYSYNYRIEGRTDYNVTTPFVFSGGFSVPLGPLMVAVDGDFTDWTQMRFSNADPLVEQYNTDIKEIFRTTGNVRLGLEYELEQLRLRLGYARNPSPYRNDPSSFTQQYITGGLGFIAENIIAIDLGYAHGFWETYHVQYDGSPRTNEKIKTSTLMATFSYRF